jgi:hypothetical protein
MTAKVRLGLAAALFMLVAIPSYADIDVYVSFDGGTTTLVADSVSNDGPATFSGAFDPGSSFTVSGLSALSNSPGTPGIAKELSDTLDIDNGDSVAHTIEFFIVAQGFTAPVTPPSLTLFSQIGGSVVTSTGSDTLSFASCVDPGNGNTACPGGSSGTTTGTVPITFPTGDSSSTTIASLTGTYSISEELILDLGAGAEYNFSANTKLTAVPEPVSVGWMAGGILLLAGLYKRTRRAKQA